MKVIELLEDWFDESDIKEKDQIDYILLCNYYDKPKTFKNKHFKKLKSKLEKEKIDICK